MLALYIIPEIKWMLNCVYSLIYDKTWYLLQGGEKGCNAGKGKTKQQQQQQYNLVSSAG